MGFWSLHFQRHHQIGSLKQFNSNLPALGRSRGQTSARYTHKHKIGGLKQFKLLYTSDVIEKNR